MTRAHPRDAYLLDGLRSAGASVALTFGGCTTSFEIAATPDRESRSASIVSVAEPFAPADLGSIRARALCLGPLTGGDMPPGFIEAAVEHGERAFIDVQGLVRPSRPGRVSLAAYDAGHRVLPLADMLKADIAEALQLTGERSAEKAIEALLGLGPSEVLVTQGARGALVGTAESIQHVAPLPSRDPVGTTGAGDCYGMGYVCARLRGADAAVAARFAAAVAALKLQRQGPFAGTAEEAAALAGVEWPPRPAS